MRNLVKTLIATTAPAALIVSTVSAITAPDLGKGIRVCADSPAPSASPTPTPTPTPAPPILTPIAGFRG